MSVHLFRHFRLKLLSLGLAIVLWLAIAGDPLVERGLRAPLEYQNVPDGLALVGTGPSTIDVRVRGSSALLAGLSASDVVAVLDLGAARSGRRLFHLSPAEVRAPFGVEIAQVSPSTIPLTLERSGRRFVPIEPVVEGTPAPGYVIVNVSTSPASVEVEGPVSRLADLAVAITEPVQVTDATETVEAEVSVGVSDDALRLAQAGTATVIVQIETGDLQQVSRRVTVAFRNLVPERRATPTDPTVTVRASGSRQALDGFRADLIDAFVDLAGLDAGRYTVSVHVGLGPELEVEAVEPAMLEIEIR